VKTSKRSRRLARHQNLQKKPVLNLVSLMDIFTILVFFLLVNSSNTHQLPSNKDLKLPTSVAKKAPAETLVIAITPKDVLVQGRKVITVAELLASGEESIPALQKELEYQATVGFIKTSPDNKSGKAVTIMGDENIPYELVRKILKTCQQADYRKIAFAANQIAKDS